MLSGRSVRTYWTAAACNCGKCSLDFGRKNYLHLQDNRISEMDGRYFIRNNE
jgi:hypothetical protein